MARSVGASAALAHAAALAAALAAAAGCARETISRGEASDVPVDGGTCVVGMFSDLDGLNEFVSTDAVATSVMERVLYMPLFRWAKDLTIEGRLAKSWEYSADSTVVTVHIRDDVRWHDGAPTTAHDVKFTFDRMMDPVLGYPDRGTLRHIQAVEVVDDTTIRFRFALAYLDQLAHLRRVILPKHLLESVPNELMESAEFNHAPVGNGPFRFVRWKRDQEIVFEANPDFADGRPHLDRLIFRVIPDQTSLETSFRSGQIDYVERLRFSEVASLRKDPRFQVFTYPQRGYQFIGWNRRDPLFSDSRVRRAMTLAIDRQRILDALAFGEGKVTAHPVMSLSPYCASDIPAYPYDPEGAKILLAQAGWKDEDGDGVIENGGTDFEFTLVTNLGNQMREDALVMIQNDLKKVGVAVKPQVREWTVFLDEVKAKKFQAFHMAWETDFIMSPYDIFHSAAIEGKYNMVSFSNPRVDSLIERGLVARTPDEAKSIWHEYQALLHEDQPYTILYELAYSVGVAERIRGVEVDVRSWLLNVEDWWARPGASERP
jgi:peptide/nickel transport system substrate-binding protein